MAKQAKHFYTARRRKAAAASKKVPKVHRVEPGTMGVILATTCQHPDPKGKGRGPLLQGGLPPRVRDNSKAFNSYAPVWGVRCAPGVIGATTGVGRVIGRRVTNGRDK